RFIVVLSLVLAFAWAAEEVGGLAAISGAYLVGVLLGRTVMKEQLTEFGNLIGYAFFAPVFFSITGMSVDLGALAEAPVFTMLLVAVAVVTKAAGCYAGSLAGGFSHGDSLSVGLGMVARGEVALVMAVLGREEGLLNDEAFAAAIAMTLLTTLVTPLVLPLALRSTAPSTSASREPAAQAT
ncbi:MAG TPA: cation:proton antiporter, partial [Dehalococcoidia bacterium]|nr:cation:proton antiporter [Dehalococcoidia bacterium]